MFCCFCIIQRKSPVCAQLDVTTFVKQIIIPVECQSQQTHMYCDELIWGCVYSVILMTKGKGCGVTNYIKTAYHITWSASIISNRIGNLPYDWPVYEVRKKKKTNNKSGQDFYWEIPAFPPSTTIVNISWCTQKVCSNNKHKSHKMFVQER